MNVELVLAWEKASKKKLAAIFKNKALGEAFQQYFSRVENYSNISYRFGLNTIEDKSPGTKLWLCHFSKKAKNFKSEEVADLLKSYQNQGVKNWQIVIGPPDGFSDNDLKTFPYDELWSFGQMTLPHELASVVMVEQVYRAFTILKGEPYHLGH